MKSLAPRPRPESHLRVMRAVDLPAQLPQKAWLVRELWSHLAVGFIGGQPKCGKTWLALDLAVSVASGTHCLGRFPVEQPGTALAYLAEDSLPHVRQRLAGLCAQRSLPLASLDLHLIDAPSLRLDDSEDQSRLLQAITRIKPRLLVLDPLVRLHSLDENSAADVSSLLGWLRALSRTHQLAIVVVHHMSKKSRRQLGQALRGSSDLHAWADSRLPHSPARQAAAHLGAPLLASPSPAASSARARPRRQYTPPRARPRPRLTCHFASPHHRPSPPRAPRSQGAALSRRPPQQASPQQPQTWRGPRLA